MLSISHAHLYSRSNQESRAQYGLLFTFLVFLFCSLAPVNIFASPATIVLDNFEASFPSGLWQAGADETGGSGCRWARTVSKAASGHASISPIGADCNPSREDIFGPLPPDANIWLKYGPFDLSGHTSAEVSMRFNAIMNGNDRIWIGHNLSNSCVGDTPFQGQNFYNGNGGTWTDLSVDISSRAGQSNVCVYIVLTTDSTYTGGIEFAFIDDVKIQADGDELAVGTELELHSIAVRKEDYYAGDEVTIAYSVTNHGDTASAAWDIDFWAAGRIEFYPFVGDHFLGDSSGELIAPSETRQLEAIVNLSNSLTGPATWSVRGFLNFQDANPQNNVAVHAISLRNLGVKGDVLAEQTAEGAFPSGDWTVAPDTGINDTNCQWGTTNVAGNGSVFSLSPFAEQCTNPVNLLTGPLPDRTRIPLFFGPINAGDALSLRMTFRYFTRMALRNEFVVWTRDAGVAGCGSEGEYTFRDALREFETGWRNAEFTLPISSELCIKLEFRSHSTANIDGDNWFFVDDLQFIANHDGLEVSSNETLEGNYRPGDFITLRPIVQNIGIEAISDFEINYEIRNVRVYDTGTVVGQLTGLSLNVGESQQFAKTVQIPVNTTPSLYRFQVQLDYKGNWNDRKTSLEATIRVEGSPDIEVSPLTLNMDFSPNAVAQNGITTIVDSPPVAAPIEHTSPIALLRQKNVADLRLKARRNGSVRVIVELTGSGYTASTFKNVIARQTNQQAIRSNGDDVLQTMQNMGLGVTTNYQYRNIPYLALNVDAASLDFLAKSANIGSISEDRVSAANMESSNVVVRTAEMWASNYAGSGQAVAILDTGVDSSHSWFNNGANKIIAEACFSTATADSESLCPGGLSPDLEPGSASVCDVYPNACEHGTHVAGTASGNNGSGPGYGVARESDIIAVQVFSYYPSLFGLRAKQSDQIAALEHVLELADTISIAAVNMSLGSGKFLDQESCDLDNAASKAAIDNLRAVGIATVISAGNSSYKDGIGEPGCISSAISVGATTDDDAVADFSNIYPQLHLLAPGVDITSSVPGEQLESFNGTSMAAPHVTGAFAILRQIHPSASVDDLLLLLQTTGDLVDDLRAGGIETNMRRINLGQALVGEADDSYVRLQIRNGPQYSTLNVTAIETIPSTAWISIDPPLPYVMEDEQLKVIKVRVDKSQVPEGLTQVRLLIHSDDPDESPYPAGVYLEITRKGEMIMIDSFEN